MQHTYILNIETATTVCSVSLARNGEVLALREENNGYTHAENLHVFVEEVMRTANLDLKALSAVAVSRGPGSYTGLRIGASAAKGYAYVLQIPLLALDTLQVMAAAAKKEKSGISFFCPMIDARRMEVYTAVYGNNLETLLDTEALVITEESVKRFTAYEELVFFGDGMPKCRDLLTPLNNSVFMNEILPTAAAMCELSYQKFLSEKFESVAYFEPLYLKEFMIKKAT